MKSSPYPGQNFDWKMPLQHHIGLLGERSDDPTPVEVGKGRTGRIDLMLQRVVQPRAGEFDYLVVELKRPSRKIDAKVSSRSRSTPSRSPVIPVSMVLKRGGLSLPFPMSWMILPKKRATQRDTPKGRVYDDGELHIAVWVKTWAEVITDAKARLKFVNEQLATKQIATAAKAYLKEKHAKFIPTQAQIDAKEQKEKAMTAKMTGDAPEPAKPEVAGTAVASSGEEAEKPVNEESANGNAIALG